MFSFVGYFGLGRPPARAQNSRKKLRLRREYSSANRSPAPAHRDPVHTKFHLACRRRGAFCKGIVSTPARRGPTFVCAKVGKTRSRGTDSPLDEPLSVACSAGYERCKSIVRTAHRYAPKVAAGASAPTALRCPKKSSRCSLARFFRPLRVLRLAASATGGARLRTPYPSPVAGEGSSGQIASGSNFSLGSVTLCASLLGKT